MKPLLMLAILGLALVGHYVSQKVLLAKGWKADNPQPQIKRLQLNGSALLLVSVVALIVTQKPYGLIGLLLFIEAAACFSFARKLSKK